MCRHPFLVPDFISYVPTFRKLISKTMPNWSFIRNNRGTPQLYYEGYIYRIDRNNKLKNIPSKAKIYFSFRCSGPESVGCRGRLAFNGNRLVKSQPHSHLPAYQTESDCEIEYKSFEDDDILEWLKGSE